MAEYQEVKPPAALADWVECGWMLHSVEPVAGHRVLPDGALDIVYDRELGLRVVGAMTVEQRFDLRANALLVGVRFRPGMAGTLLQVEPSTLTDGFAQIADSWGTRGRTLRDRLNDAGSGPAALCILLQGLHVPERKPSPVQRAITAIAASHGSLDLDRAAGEANLSPRQFRRRCQTESGLSPKLLARILRFRYASLAAAKLPARWSFIATEAGYCDQAHLIRDFRRFSGCAPMSLLSNTRAQAAK